VVVERLTARGFRNLADAEVELDPGINLAWGPNAAGKTNLLEALCAALSGRSPRTSNEREAIGFGLPIARAEALLTDGEQRLTLSCAISRAEGRHHRLDGRPMSAADAAIRPPLAVFVPERLALVKGPPATRRQHLDRFVAALWPARTDWRRRYGRALAQRNALLGRVRSGAAPADSLEAWDQELAAAGVELIGARSAATALLAPTFAETCAELGLEGRAELAYAPRSEATEASQLGRELAERRESDLARGFTTWGPHLDELALRLDGRRLRRYGSQGQHRIAVLALLFAERAAMLAEGRPPPLMLLDDVASELDAERRALLCGRLEAGGGQALLTATEPDQVPPTRRKEIALRGGRVIARAGAGAGADAASMRAAIPKPQPEVEAA
jgi:DNA replication and repair protein RecF